MNLQFVLVSASCQISFNATKEVKFLFLSKGCSNTLTIRFLQTVDYLRRLTAVLQLFETLMQIHI